MGPPTIGILGSRVSREVQRVREALRRRGATVRLADLSGFPAIHRARLTLDQLQVGTLSLDEAPVWLLRQPETPSRIALELSRGEGLDLREDISSALIDDREVWALIRALIWSLADVARVVNSPEAAALHERKPLLCARLARAGLAVPASLTTTDRAAAEAFVEGWQGQAICKAAAGGGETRLARDVLNELGATSALSGPLLFQQRIIGPSLRGYVVDGELLSCAEVIHGDVVDWRADQRGLRPHHAEAALTEVFTTACAAAGLDYAGIDVELDGRSAAPYVLDVNPSPLFASWESVSGDDLAGPLADLLLREARR